MADDDSLIGKIVLSAAIVVAAIPGLIVEPGPLSELAALAALAAVWGMGDAIDMEGSA